MRESISSLTRSVLSIVFLFVLFAGVALFPKAVGAGEINENGSGEYSYDVLESDLPLSLMSNDLSTNSQGISVVELGGAERYDTVAAEALYAYDSSETVVIASGVGYADSIAASGLAGALDCPILLVQKSAVPSVTADALRSLGAKNAVLIGGYGVIDSRVENQVRSILGSDSRIDRLSGADRYATQMAIFEYGRSRGIWNTDLVLIASATGFADALSGSSVAFAEKAPVFFCNAASELSTQQRAAFEKMGATSVLVLGGTGVTSNSLLSYCNTIAGHQGGSAVRLGGLNRYETSVSIANYAVSQLGFSWDGVAFASGQGPYDSLGGAVVQGRERSVLLLADGTNYTTVDAIRNDGGSVENCLKFFGGTGVIPDRVRTIICLRVGSSFSDRVAVTQYPISLASMTNIQLKRGESGLDYEDYYNALNPTRHQYGTAAFFQFAVLNQGYSGVSAAAIDQFVAKNCGYQESSRDTTSTLRNAGSYFVEAARTYNVNEVYLLSHAIFESAWGCSDLATGWTPDKDGSVTVNGVSYPYKKGVTYYNFFGIGAVDTGPLSGGRAMAVKEGWTSPRAAILGAAKWISTNYLNRALGQQNTLYLMKWDVPGAVANESAWHEYCTGLDSWVLGISNIMSNCYAAAGYSSENAPVRFNYPVYL